MNILHTIYDDVANPWCGGGGAVRAFEINRRLAQKHRIIQVTGNFPGAPPQEVRENIDFRRVGSTRNYALSRLSFCARASRIVTTEPFDLWVYDFSAFSPVLAGAQYRNRAILLLHHLMSTHAARKYPGIGRLAGVAETAHLRTYRRFIAVSESTAQQIADQAPDAQIHTVHNGVDAACFVPDLPEENYILFFGRLDIYTKGIDILLAAFARLQEPYPNLRLVLAGRATPKRQQEVRSRAETLGISNRVEVTGPVSDEQKHQLFGRALFFCLASRYEGWGMVAIEAGAAGKAVVGTSIPGLIDAVRHGETGLLVPPEDEVALANTMDNLLRNPDLRRKLGTQGRKWAQHFTWDRIAREQEEAYLQAIEQEPIDNC